MIDPAGITPIDCQYLVPRFAAAYLMVENGRALFVDNNTAHSVPLMLAALQREGLTPFDVDYLIITHVHLDHAGGSDALMRACPNARLLAHPRAAPHMIDPGKLIEGARRVYGDQRFHELYGEIGPIDPTRVRIMADGESLRFGGRVLQFLHTRGHANHHFCIYDERSRAIFTGDAFGLCYPDLQTHGLMIFPSTSPTDFIPSEARKSIQRILDTGATRAYLTHFGGVDELQKAAGQLLMHLEFSEGLLNEATDLDGPDAIREDFCRNRIQTHFQEVLARIGLDQDRAAWEILKLDLELNAQGIAYAAKKLHGLRDPRNEKKPPGRP